MATPNGTVVDEVNTGEEGPCTPRGMREDRGEWETTPAGHRGDRDRTGAPCGVYDSDFLEPPDPIEQLVAALHDAGLGTNPRHQRCHGLDPDPDSDDDRRRPKVKIPPPIFKGLPGERPDAHLLATADWMEAMGIRPDGYIDNFKHTLHYLHLAHEWYHGLNITDFHDDWHEFNRHFSRYFSTQGRNIKHLHERWRTFSFDPSTDDIEEYIRDVREADKQLGHGDDAVLNLLKATMPTELYGTLYGYANLHAVMTMLKDMYAKKPQNMVATATGAAAGATAPFTHICSPTVGDPKAQSDVSLEDRILQLTETLYCIDMNGKPPRKPFKPFITQPRKRFKPEHNGHNGHFAQSNGRSFPSN